MATTDARHDGPIYPNLLRGADLDGLDQAWVADITSIRLPTTFAYLACILDACPDAASDYPLIQQFVRILRQSNAELLDPWLTTAAARGVADLQTFASGLREEFPALEAALKLSWSTGPVEGQITRLNLIKRQAYGRAGIDTLRRRVLRAA